ncbi:Lipase (class 3) [Pseudoalteromonas sp. THAF3]|uniref:lipase family protein n=1 Tax=Pseudoalteromonas sp. THAF3 TaxID=2587843 RepID=UPI0012684968|nr:lipase family protein [Pseudoalteromonas sp. THAF3]QFU04737.1 Lipase (class 3) [Pseudoalteromonas sp. THAF3]
MNTLSPRQASELAAMAYRAKGASKVLDVRSIVGPNLRNSFEFVTGDSVVDGVSGGFFSHLFGLSTGFAFVGKGINEFAGDSVIAIRGTASLRDGLTDLNCGLSASSSNKMVHAGFNKTFNSMKQAFAQFVDSNRKAGNTGVVHCVGHSLGGALAQLTADWVNTEYSLPTKLYTFGAPRVGKTDFARSTTTKLENIYRSTHGADPVPKVPLWPFIHAPFNGSEFRLDDGQGLNVSAHKLDGTPGYLNTASSSDWSTLKQRSDNFLSQPVRLRFEDRAQASFSSHWADKISSALITLLKDSGYYTAVVTQAAISSSLTFYDMVARTLEQVAKASARFAEQTLGLLGHMLVFAGKVVGKAFELTYKMIKWVFDSTMGALYRSVRGALNGLD